MAERDRDYSAADEMEMNKWRRRLETAEDRAEHATRSMKNTLKKLMQDANNKRNVAKDMIDATKSRRNNFKSESGFNIVEEEDPTGFEPLPWANDD
jgi:hypothetical protein